ncbi:hypothetical protein C8R47DRAFT_1079972 [Mycena vitilis]|nr:hypothetical protein C8R47DRAFT_1079972 [Mycena vitilis]
MPQALKNPRHQDASSFKNSSCLNVVKTSKPQNAATHQESRPQWDTFKTSRRLKHSRLQDPDQVYRPGGVRKTSDYRPLGCVQDLGGILSRLQAASRPQDLKPPQDFKTRIKITGHLDVQDVKTERHFGLVPAHLAVPTTCACVN